MGRMRCSQCGRAVAGTIVSLCPACGGDLEVVDGGGAGAPPPPAPEPLASEASEPLEVTSRSGRMALEVDDRPVVVDSAVPMELPEPSSSARFPKPPLPPSLADPGSALFPDPGAGRAAAAPRPTSPPLELDGPPLAVRAEAATEAAAPPTMAPPPPIHEPPTLPEPGTSLQPDELTLAEMPDWAGASGVMIPTLPGEVDGPPLELEDAASEEAVTGASTDADGEDEIVGFTPEPGLLPPPEASRRVYSPLVPGEDQVLLKRAAAALAAAALRPQEPLDEAVDACRHVLHWNPGNRRALVLLADLLERQGDLGGAAETCREFLTLQPGNQRMANKLAGLEEALELQRRAAPPAMPAHGYAPPASPAPHPSEPPYPSPTPASWQASGAAASAQSTFAPPPPVPVTDGLEWTAPSERDGGGAPYSVWAIVAFASVFLCPCILIQGPMALVALSETSSRGMRGRGLAIAALICSLFLTVATVLVLVAAIHGAERQARELQEQFEGLTDVDVYDQNELAPGPQGFTGPRGPQVPGGVRGPAVQPPSMPGMGYQGGQLGALGLAAAFRRPYRRANPYAPAPQAMAEARIPAMMAISDGQNRRPRTKAKMAPL